MSGGRLFRSLGDVMLPADDSTPDAQASVPAVGKELRRPIREAKAGSERDDELPFAAVLGPGGRLIQVRGRLDVCRRMPAMEVWAAGFTGERIRVWATNCQTLPDLSAVVQEGHVFLNMAAQTWRCPVLRLAVLRHELEHVARGDRGGVVSAEAEDECEKAAEAAIVGIVESVDRTQPALTGAPTDAGTCQRCYREGTTTCRQREGTLARVLGALEPFTR